MTEKEIIKDGLYEGFHENGQLDVRGNFKNGKNDGLWEYFYKYNFLYKYNILTKTEEWKDGELVE